MATLAVDTVHIDIVLCNFGFLPSNILQEHISAVLPLVLASSNCTVFVLFGVAAIMNTHGLVS